MREVKDTSTSTRAWRAMLSGLSAIALVLPGTLEGQNTGQASQVARGAAVYGNMCGRCHNPRSPLERDDRDWVTIVTHMRIRGNLTGDQVRSVLAFLQATNSDPSQPSPVGTGEATTRHVPVEVTEAPIATDPELIALGERLITEKACIGCHIVGSGGGNVGPSMNGITDRRDPLFLRQKLANPTFDNATSMMPNFGLTAEEIEAILAYLATLNGNDE
jgi:mono/diheme cytochrome c family protein